MRSGKNRLSLWEPLLFAVSCVNLQYHGVLTNLRDTGPWPSKEGLWLTNPSSQGTICPPCLPVILPQARYEKEIRADIPAKHRPQPSKANLVPRHQGRLGHLCACEACQGEKRLGPAFRCSWHVGWAGLLSILHLAVEELEGTGRRSQRSTRKHNSFENKGSLRK